MADNVFFLLCLLEAVIFSAAALVSLKKKDFSAFLISSELCSRQKVGERYDLAALTAHLRKVFWLCAAISAAGAVAALFFPVPAFWISLVAWIIPLFSNVRVDHRKMLEKYKK